MDSTSGDSCTGSNMTSVESESNETTRASSIDSANVTPKESGTSQDEHAEDQKIAQHGQLQGTESIKRTSTERSGTETNQNKAEDAATIPSNGKLAELVRAKDEYYDEIIFDEDDKAAWIAKTAKAMQWLLSEAASKPEPEPELDDGTQDADVRAVATSELKVVTWTEWRISQGPVTESHSAIYLLSEEPPVRPTGLGIRSIHKMTKARQGTQNLEQEMKLRGGLTLPPRILIRSLPIMRILLGLCDDKLNFSRNEGLIILRPFKIFEFLEQDIRARLDELHQARYDQGPQAKLLTSELANQVSNGDAKAAHTKSSFDIDTVFGSGTDWTSLNHDEKEEAARDFECLVSFIDQYIVPMKETLRTATEVYFTQLWHLFSPGSLIYVKDKATPQKVWRVIQGTGGRRNMIEVQSLDQPLKLGAFSKNRCNPFVLDCYYIDWNGNRYIRIHKRFVIEEFSDLQPIASLPVLPFHMAEQQGLINREELMERAAQFVECTKPSYRYYSGRSMNSAPGGSRLWQVDNDMGRVLTVSEYVESQVMVDFERGLQTIPDWAPDAKESTMSATPDEEVSGDANHQFTEDDRVWDVRIAERVLDLQDYSSGWEKQDPNLSDDEKLLLPARVIAFVFRTRRWVCLELGRDPKNPKEQRLKAVEAKPEAWGELEISPNHRNVIESLMASHFTKSKTERRQFDFVKDKGKGIIILLHGVPGVGKTSTAETVAEYYNKPLLPITCGDLGVTPRDVERNLESCFQMAQAWECVLLLDEADIFLAARNTQNENRNALVSVFLRVLEYYEGVLFLTTNQVGSFDEAFKSRISMALYYPPLSLEQTLHIWTSQMKRVSTNFPEIRLNDIELQYYARELYDLQSKNEHYKPVWNGRQIRNAFQTAVSMAEFETKDKQNIQLTRTHFERVAEVSNQFNMYLWRVKWSRTDEYRMRVQGLRDDSFTYDTAPVTARVPSPVPPYQMQPPSYLTPQPSAVQQVAPLNMGNPTYPQPAMNPGQYIPPVPYNSQPYNSQPQGYPGGQNPQYSGVQPQPAYTANQPQPQYISSSGYPSQSQGIQTQVPVQQQMAPPSNQNPQTQSLAQYGVSA